MLPERPAVPGLKEPTTTATKTIVKGVYTVRYGIQPVNGDHLGVSPYRDYALLLPAAKDATTDDLAKKPLEERSAESAGTSHPAILMLLKAPESGPPAPAITRDEEKNTWGAVVPLKLDVKGSDSPSPLNIQLIVVGRGDELTPRHDRGSMTDDR